MPENPSLIENFSLEAWQSSLNLISHDTPEMTARRVLHHEITLSRILAEIEVLNARLALLEREKEFGWK